MTLTNSLLRQKSPTLVVIDAHEPSYTRYVGNVKTHKAFSKGWLLDHDGAMDFLHHPPSEFAAGTNPEAA